MKKYLLILLLPVWHFVIAQKDDKLKFFPQSPEVQSLQKFIDQPVSLHNGTADISVPIYTLKINSQLSLPLSASYNTSGIKVGERAGSIGLGWNLTNPGVVIRSMRGEPDNLTSLQAAHDDLKDRVYNFDLYNDVNANNLLATIDETDYEPDEYIINFLGNSLKVVFDGSIPGNDLGKKFVQIPLSDHKVVASLNGGFISGWEVTDPQGNIFYFGSETANQNTAVEFENSPAVITYGSTQGGNNSTPSYAKTWHLIKVKTTDNKIVQFYYQNKGNSTVASVLGETSYKCGTFNYNWNSNQLLQQLCQQQSLPATQISYTLQTNDDLYIDRIESETTKIKFNHLTVRQDIDNAKRLDNINISDSKNHTIKKIDFVFSYFQPTTTDNCFINKIKNNGIFSSHITTQSKRLKLDKILESDPQNTKISEYKFEYFSNQMPNIMSSAQDHWGYYNGKDSNCGFLPSIQFRVANDLYPGIYLMGKNVRKESEDHLKYGSLTKITYPTGGSINLEYEKNTVSAFMDENVSSYMEINPTYEIAVNAEQHVDLNTNEPYYSDLEYNIQLGYDSSFSFGLPDYEYNPEGMAYYRNFKIESTDPSFQTRFISYNESIPVKKFETYKITAELNPQSLQNSQFSDEKYTPEFGAMLKVYYRGQREDLSYAGGLRIKKITHKDTDDTPQIIKEFDYGDSGIGLNYPFYVEQEYISHLPLVKLYGLATFPLNSIFSNNIIYESVTTYQVNVKTGDKIKSEYKFKATNIDQLMEVGDYNVSDHMYRRTLFSLPMRRSYSNWRLGNLVKQTDYIFSNGSYQIQKETLNTYGKQKDYYYNNPIFGLRLEKRGYWEPAPGFEGYNTYKWEFYSIYTEKYDLLNSKTTNYFNSVSNQTVSDYFYNNPAHYQLNKQKTTFPDGTIDETNYSYAHEKANQKLINANMIGIPLET
ncbi:hypothetical protein, partial [Chryseobacterium elymi]|uniref:hypothetical protein n=1 Tax=Chryseobacterium elymi TaxID=395936 RepID=UPI001058DDAF